MYRCPACARRVQDAEEYELFEEGLESYLIAERLGLDTATVCKAKKKWRTDNATESRSRQGINKNSY
jgi:hypothetical protein